MTLQEILDSVPHAPCKCDRLEAYKWERMAEVFIGAAGYVDISWRTSERDLFGPLVRAVKGRLFGIEEEASYG